MFVNVVDPIGNGLVASLARPGGNFTGFIHFESGMAGKWLEMLQQVAPPLTRAAILYSDKTLASHGLYMRAVEAAAPSFGCCADWTPANDAAEIERVIDTFVREPNGGLIVLPDATPVVNRDDHHPCKSEPFSRSLPLWLLCPGWRPDVLRGRCDRPIPASGILR